MWVDQRYLFEWPSHMFRDFSNFASYHLEKPIKSYLLFYCLTWYTPTRYLSKIFEWLFQSIWNWWWYRFSQKFVVNKLFKIYIQQQKVWILEWWKSNLSFTVIALENDCTILIISFRDRVLFVLSLKIDFSTLC